MSHLRHSIRTVCKRIRSRLSSRLGEVMLLFEKHDADGSGQIDAEELREVLNTELGVDITVKESVAIISRFDVDDSGSIEVKEFDRFLRGELAIDKKELVLKLQASFALCEQSGTSVVKLFTAVDRTNLGLVAFAAVRTILHKYIGVSLSNFEMLMLEKEYGSALDENQCRYTDLYR